jgi:hypothetical protein
LGELDEKPNHTKISSFEILKEMFAKQSIHFFNHLAKQMCSMGSKCLALGAHVEEIILPKNMFGCPLKLTLGLYGILCVFLL